METESDIWGYNLTTLLGNISTETWTSRLGLYARLTTLLCAKIITAKFKEILRNGQIWQNPLKKVMVQKGCLSNDGVDDDDAAAHDDE
jgi:hypothetical protein